MVLIAVDSVFQLVNAMNIAYYEYSEQKVIILLKSIHSKTFWGEMNKDKNIYGVYYTNKKYENRLNEIIWQIEALLFPKSATRRLINDKVVDFKISAIIASITWVDLLSPIYRTYKGAAKLYFVEEGVGTYVKQDRIFGKKSIINSIKFKLLKRQYIVDKGIFRFLLPNYMENSHLKFEESPTLSSSIQFKERLLNFFNGEKDVFKLKNYRIIYLEQTFNVKDESSNINEFDKLEELVKDIIIADQNAIIKSHPRYSRSQKDKHLVLKSMMPWEAIITAIDINNKILVSISSTSIVTPKIMQNREPIVICLVKVFEEFLKLSLPKDRYKEVDNLIDFFSFIKSTYTNPNRFKIPSSIIELRSIMDNLDNI